MSVITQKVSYRSLDSGELSRDGVVRGEERAVEEA
jgi:hypothetical protein